MPGRLSGSILPQEGLGAQRIEEIFEKQLENPSSITQGIRIPIFFA